MHAPVLAEDEPIALSFGLFDVVDEIRLRTWARRNFVEADERQDDWPEVVLDEMARIDRESAGR